jgi:hypothetical protein
MHSSVMPTIDVTKRLKVTAEFVKSLQSDLRKMTAIYKSIPASSFEDPNGKIFNEAADLFHVFSENLKDMVYKQIIDKDTSEKDSWAEKQLRETVWSLAFALTSGGTARGADMFPRTSASRRAPPDHARLEKNRETNIRRFQAEARKFFAAIEDWVDLMQRTGESTDREALVERVSLAGATIVIKKTNEKDWVENWGKTIDESLRLFLPSLESTLGRIRKMGFGAALDNLVIDIDFRRSERVAGQYLHGPDQLVVFPWGFMATTERARDHTLTHEVGHRFWFRNMNEQGRDAWVAAFHNKERKTTVTAESVDMWVKAITVKSPNDYWKSAEKEALVQRLMDQSDRSTAAQLRYLADEGPDLQYGESAEDYRKRCDKLIGEQISDISDYGETNPQEAYAEAFRIYITKGPSALSPQTRQVFKEVSETSGSRIAGRAEVIRVLRAAAKLLT